MGRASKSSDDADQVQSQQVAGEDDASGGRPEPESIRLAVKLPPKQRIACDALGSGCGVPEAARRAGVDRTTVSRWLHHDAKFIAAYNALILDNIKSSRAEMASLLPLASAALRKELEKGNGWLALQFYREARSLGLLEVGPTSPKAVKEELKLAQQVHEAELMKKQMQLQEQQMEIDKLRAKLDLNNREKKIEAAKEEGYWYAFMAFYADWSDAREDPHQEHSAQIKEREQKQRKEHEKYARAFNAQSPEKSRQLIAEADRLQQQDQEKKQRGERVKSAAEQANDLGAKWRRANKQRAKEHESLKQQPDERGDAQGDADQHAEDQQPAVEQQSSNDQQPAPDSHQHDERHQEVKQRREVEQQAAPDDRPAAEHRPADDSAKSNPDIAPFDLLTLAQDRPPAGVRSEQDPQGELSVESDPDDTDELNE